MELTKENTITGAVDINSEEYKKYIEWSQKNDVDIIATLKNNTSVSTSFITYGARNKIIVDLYNNIVNKKYQGVCIDFTDIDDINSFYRFLIELTPKFKESGLKVIVKSNSLIENEKIKNVVDSII